MPNKLQTGDSPLGANGVTGANLSPASGLVRIEQEIKKRTPQTGTNVGRWNLPNGVAILPKRVRAVGAANPWRVTLLKNDVGAYEAYISEGNIYDGLLSVNAMAFETEIIDGEARSIGQGDTVAANDVVCIKYTYDGGTLEFAIQSAGAGFTNWDSQTLWKEETGDPAATTATYYPLAKIVDTGGGALAVEQIATNHLAKVSLCKNGEALTSFAPF